MALNFKKIKHFENIENLNETAARFICKLANEKLKKQEIFTLALSGGRTPLALYKLLGKKPYISKVNRSNVHIFWVDERFVSEKSKYNNFANFKKSFNLESIKKLPSIAPSPPAGEGKNTCLPLPLRERVGVRGKDRQSLIYTNMNNCSFHKIDTGFKNPDKAAKNYQFRLKKFFGSKKLPRFDLIILGIGKDGHTASLFPNTAILKETKKWAVSTSYKKAKPEKRITLTFPVLNNAKNILFLVSGKEKKNMLKKITTIKKDDPKYPVSLLNPKGKTSLFTDIEY